MSLLAGNRGTRKISSGRLYFKESGSVGYINFGNVELHQHEVPDERTKIAESRNGSVKTIDERRVMQEQRFKVTLTEELERVTAAALLAAAPSAGNQSSGTDVSESFVGVNKSQVILLGARNVSNVVVEVATVAKTLGTDYTLEAGPGVITILPGGTIADGATVDVTYDKPAISQKTFVSGQQLQLRGEAVLHEEDDNSSKIPRNIWSFSAVLFCTARGDQDGKKVATWELELLATSDVTVTQREDS